MGLINKWKIFEDSDLIGCTLLIPSIAVANIGQLVCDLLISSLKMKKVASLYSPALMPVLGYDPYDLESQTLSGYCELYKCEEKKTAVLQVRAPLIYKYARNFLEELIDTLKEKNVKDIIILTSSFDHEKKNVSTSPFRYVMNDRCPYRNEVNKINLMEHESSEDKLKILGGGCACLLYQICTEKSLPTLILYKYCSEGDNIPDTYDAMRCLSNIIPLFSAEKEFVTQLVQPVSWKLFYGKPPPKHMY